MDSRICLLINPAAGGGRAAEAAAAVEAELGRLGIAFGTWYTKGLAHAGEISLAAGSRGEAVVALGGDGLIGAVADALRRVEGAVMGVLPGGRGNDFARVLGIPCDPVAACAAVAAGARRKVDLGEAGSRAFVGIASVGFDSDANRIANEAPAALGKLVYGYGALRALLSWTPARFEVMLEGGDGSGDPDGEVENTRSGTALVTFRGFTVAMANSRAYGGGMFMAPDASLEDGMLDVVCIADVPKTQFVASLPKVFAGSHVRLPSVAVHRAREVLVSADRPFTVYADGDPIGELPLRLRAVPAAIEVLAPESVPRVRQGSVSP